MLSGETDGEAAKPRLKLRLAEALSLSAHNLHLSAMDWAMRSSSVLSSLDDTLDDSMLPLVSLAFVVLPPLLLLFIFDVVVVVVVVVLAAADDDALSDVLLPAIAFSTDSFIELAFWRLVLTDVV